MASAVDHSGTKGWLVAILELGAWVGVLMTGNTIIISGFRSQISNLPQTQVISPTNYRGSTRLYSVGSPCFPQCPRLSLLPSRCRILYWCYRSDIRKRAFVYLWREIRDWSRRRLSQYGCPSIQCRTCATGGPRQSRCAPATCYHIRYHDILLDRLWDELHRVSRRRTE